MSDVQKKFPLIKLAKKLKGLRQPPQTNSDSVFPLIKLAKKLKVELTDKAMTIFVLFPLIKLAKKLKDELASFYSGGGLERFH